MAIEAKIPEALPSGLIGEDIPIALVHEDEHLAVVMKPAGLVVHPGHGARRGTLVHALLGQGVALAPAGGVERPGIVHRLDKGTSGLLLIAKTDEAHGLLSAMFARRDREDSISPSSGGARGLAFRRDRRRDREEPSRSDQDDGARAALARPRRVYRTREALQARRWRSIS
jgi:hypothetical protein